MKLEMFVETKSIINSTASRALYLNCDVLLSINKDLSAQRKDSLLLNSVPMADVLPLHWKNQSGNLTSPHATSRR